MKVSIKKYAYALTNVLKDQTDQNAVRDIVANFLKTLKRQGQLNIIKNFLPIFEKIWRKENNIAKVNVTLAKELSNEEEQNLIKLLEKSLNKKVVLSIDIDKQIIGGMSLKIDDEMILDATLKNRLLKLKKSIS